jgi:hypothetical protein
MYEVVRGALDADDTLKVRGEEIRFRVRETAEWKKHAADLEMEMIKRGMIFEVINWSQGQAVRFARQPKAVDPDCSTAVYVGEPNPRKLLQPFCFLRARPL